MTDGQPGSRRLFLRQAAALGFGAALPPLPQAAPLLQTDKSGKGFTFLFQGDSITDGNRTRNNDWNHVMGHGYAYLIASRWWFDHPAKQFHFFNRGVSGNKVPDLAARWQADTLALHPALVSMLVGINDVAQFLGGHQNFSAREYERGYRALLEQTRGEFPEVVFVLCEPFVLPGSRVNEQWDQYRQEVALRQAVVKKLAAEFNAVWVPLQKPFNDALSKAPVEYWIWDGVHPMPAGHELIAREWIRHVRKRLRFV